MTTQLKSFVSRYFSDHRSLILGNLAFGFTITLILIFFFLSNHKLIVSSELLNQKSRANVLVQKIQNYSAISSQLGRTVRSHMAAARLNQKEIENYLQEILKSGPPNLIYGVGVWYEPFQYRRDIKLFGPYVHRDLLNREQVILTYDWNTEDYNYPKQEWYLKSLENKNQGIYIEPYFDKDLVYVTYATSFTDPNQRVIGVISVDMILPQLQSLIDEVNTTDQEVIYLESRQGFLLAHPRYSEFNQKQNEKNSDGQRKPLIHYKISDFKQKLNIQSDSSRYFRYEEVIPDLDWKVVVESNRSFILKDSDNLIKLISFGLLILWFCLSMIIVIVIRSRKNKNENELKIKTHQKQLLSSNRMATLGEFSTGLAHEVNNPLAIIMGKTEFLLALTQGQQYDREKFLAELSKIQTNATRISKIIRGLKVFSRDGEQDPLELVSLHQIINDVLSIVSDQLKSKNINFRIIPFLDLEILCRPNQLTQVLLNLVSNSVDAIETQDSPWIQIEVRRGVEIDILVTDSGLGISSETVKKMMDPFFTTKPLNKGTGLGLSISQGIVKEHHGLLYYNQSSPHTQFVIRLPISY